MRNKDTGFDDPKLSGLLRQARLSPALPARFQEGVWHRIEADAAADTVPGLPWLGGLMEAVLRPRLAVGLMITLFLSGTFLGILDGVGDSRQAAQVRYLQAVAPSALR